MGSSSCSPSCLNLKSMSMNMNMNMGGGFLSFNKSSLLTNNQQVLKQQPPYPNLSLISSSPLHSVSSSLNTQAEVDHQEELLLIQESTNGNTTTTAETQTTVGVRFQLQRECSFGQEFLITGDHPLLGCWDPNNAISLTWSDGHIWTTSAHLDIPLGICIKFKFIMQEGNGQFVWQPGPDRILECCFHTQNFITLCEDWENPDSRIIVETPDPTETINQDIQFHEPEGRYAALNTKEELLESDEGVPLLLPGLSQLPVNEDSHDESEPVNGATIMADLATDLILPELDSKVDISNTSLSNPRPDISSIHENQESCESKHQERQVAEEQDHEATKKMTSLFHIYIQWSHNILHKFLNILGIQ